MSSSEVIALAERTALVIVVLVVVAGGAAALLAWLVGPGRRPR